MKTLTADLLQKEAQAFSVQESTYPEKSLYGVTDGKKVGTYLELKFRKSLVDLGYEFEEGNAANGIDFPGLLIDMKTTSIKKPQSSCPFKSIKQKVFGLGYSLLIFVYDKTDDDKTRSATLNFTDTIYVVDKYTADYQMTLGLREILDRGGNSDDLLDFMISRNLTADEIALNEIAEELLTRRPDQGYLTISPALQWRLAYSRAITEASGGLNPGVISLYKA